MDVDLLKERLSGDTANVLAQLVKYQRFMSFFFCFLAGFVVELLLL